MSANDPQTEKIRTLNDAFRKSLIGGRVMMTRGVSALEDADRSAVMNRVRMFDDFEEANDPHGEHDFGAIEHNGEKFFWKIDYYDRNLEQGSEDPANPEETTRVMTIMLAHEY